jgi:hypothetical protein
LGDCDATQQKALVTSSLSAFGPIPSLRPAHFLRIGLRPETDPPHVRLEPALEDWQDPVMTSHEPFPPSGQHATADRAAEGNGDPPRADLNTAIEGAPAEVQQLVIGPCGEALSLIHTSLPAGELISAVLPVTPAYMGKTTNSLLVLTARRLLFVAPAPQAISWPLTEVTKFQFVPGSGPVYVHAAGGEFTLGAAPGTDAHGKHFEDLVKRAVTVAIISQP